VDRRRALTRGGTLAALALLALYVLLGGDLDLPGGGGDSTTSSTTTPTVAAPVPTTETQQEEQPSGDARISEREAAAISAVLAKIESGESLPYEQDGTTFSNREGLLPEQPAGHYKEYTVETPGSDDRGARRLVIGAGGETYYTNDHYRSFTRIDPEDYK
jgi:ribonuclease T1